MNKFLEWRNDWSLGHEIIDRQHLQLVVMFNKIVELYLNCGGKTNLDQRSNQLHKQLNIFYEQVGEHFNVEEDLMRKANYPDHTSHTREHIMLLAELKHYFRHVEDKQDNINTDTLNSLKTWFISHIISSDKKLVDFLQAYSKDKITMENSVNT